jgi:hypothetical protein
MLVEGKGFGALGAGNLNRPFRDLFRRDIAAETAVLASYADRGHVTSQGAILRAHILSSTQGDVAC